MSRNIKIVLIVILSIIAISLTALLSYLLIKRPKLFNAEPYTLVIDKTYENIYETINIVSTAGDVIVSTGEIDDIKVSITGNKETSSVKEDGKTLNISELGSKCKFFCVNDRMSKIEVVIPKDYDKNINITNKFGDIRVGEFDNAILKITENAGDVKVEAGYDVEVTNNLGDIKISNVYNYLKVKENAGNVKIDNLNIKKDSFINNDLGDIEINSTNEVFIDAKVNLGKIDIQNNNKNSEITLKIENNLGNITVR